MRKDKTLKLTLNKKAFEVMATGEKKEEFRSASKWMLSRLFDKEGNEKEYDFVKFVNGYGKAKPNFTCKYLGYREIGNGKEVHVYSNGLRVNEADIDVEIALQLGDII